MKAPVIPQTYAQWRHCIEVECGVALEPHFIDERLQTLTKPDGDDARRFAALYGAAHLVQVIGWFRQAAGSAHSRPTLR